jgi:hypothetical protein
LKIIGLLPSVNCTIYVVPIGFDSQLPDHPKAKLSPWHTLKLLLTKPHVPAGLFP